MGPIAVPTGGSCIDDHTWAGKHNPAHTCEYVGENPERRCFFENSEGVKAFDACPEACSTCSSPVASPVASPTASPVAAPTGGSCIDDHTWAGKHNPAHTCEYVGENPERRC